MNKTNEGILKEFWNATDFKPLTRKVKIRSFQDGATVERVVEVRQIAYEYLEKALKEKDEATAHTKNKTYNKKLEQIKADINLFIQLYENDLRNHNYGNLIRGAELLLRKLDSYTLQEKDEDMIPKDKVKEVLDGVTKDLNHFMSVNGYMRSYGLDEDSELDAGEIEEFVQSYRDSIVMEIEQAKKELGL